MDAGISKYYNPEISHDTKSTVMIGVLLVISIILLVGSHYDEFAPTGLAVAESYSTGQELTGENTPPTSKPEQAETEPGTHQASYSILNLETPYLLFAIAFIITAIAVISYALKSSPGSHPQILTIKKSDFIRKKFKNRDLPEEVSVDEHSRRVFREEPPQYIDEEIKYDLESSKRLKKALSKLKEKRRKQKPIEVEIKSAKLKIDNIKRDELISKIRRNLDKVKSRLNKTDKQIEKEIRKDMPKVPEIRNIYPDFEKRLSAHLDDLHKEMEGIKRDLKDAR